MKIKVSKEGILEGLQKVQTIVSTRTTLPVLSNVLIQVDGDNLLLSTTDLEVSVQAEVKGKADAAGATTLPARRLTSIIREIAESDIQINVSEKDVATLKAGSSIFKIIGIAEEEFPPLPKFKGGKTYTLDQGVFREMLRMTSYAASTDETRYVLNGVYLSFKDDKLFAVATDGRRLALVDQEVEFPPDAEADMVIPSKTITELIKNLGDEGSLKIRATENQAAFEFSTESGKMLIVTKLIDGNYPNFKQVIPSQCEERVAIEREQLFNTVKRVSLMTSDKGNSIKLALSENKLTISANTPEVGEAVETVPVKYNGKEISVAFNPEFLLDPLRNILSDEVYLELTDDLSPGVLKCDNPFIYVIMPMRMS